MQTKEDFKGTMHETDYLYLYRTLLINISKHFVFIILWYDLGFHSVIKIKNHTTRLRL